MTAYHSLEQQFAKVFSLKNTITILNWDTRVVMPPGGAKTRSDQLATLEVITHELLTAPEVADWLEAAEQEQDQLDEWQRANLREMRRMYRHETALSPELVERRAAAKTVCEGIWRAAKQHSDFKAVEAALTEMVQVVRDTAAAKSDILGVSPYDALLDMYDPYNSSADIDAVFDELAGFLPGLLDQVLAKQETEAAPLPLEGPFPVEKQEKLVRRILEQMGFDFDFGRLDVSAHPFSMGPPGDARMTTRYDEQDFLWSLTAAMHECGHAMYDNNMPKEWIGQPVARAWHMGMTMHESQSLTWDMHISRSAAFCEYAAPIIREAFGGSGPAWEAENIQRHLTRVSRNLRRVEADEISYPLHVILRYRLEKALLSGDLEVLDLPAAWNEAMESLIGVTPPDHKSGCMQDIHWYDGAFGYFPTYALGAMTAGQFMERARADIPHLDDTIRTGEFKVLADWQRENIHQKGCLYKPKELVERVTGQALNTDIYRQHLERRYLGAEDHQSEERKSVSS